MSQPQGSQVQVNQSVFLSASLSVRVDMAPEVPQCIQEWLIAAIDDLRNAVKQEAAKAFLISLTNVKPVEFKPEAAICDDFWMEFINEDFMIDASDPSLSTLSSPFSQIEDPSLWMMISQTEADTCCPAPSLHTVNSMSSNRGTTPEPCRHCQESEACQKRGRSLYNILEVVVQGLPRSDLLDCLETHWQALMMEGIYSMLSHQVLTWTLEGSLEQAHQLQHHLILWHLDIENDLHQWWWSIAERRNLNGYNIFFTEAQAKQRTKKRTRWSEERSSSKAHMEYLTHIFTDQTLKDYKRAKQGLQKDLRNGWWWSILINGFITDDSNSTPGLGLGFLLLCGPATARKLWSIPHARNICWPVC